MDEFCRNRGFQKELAVARLPDGRSVRGFELLDVIAAQRVRKNMQENRTFCQNCANSFEKTHENSNPLQERAKSRTFCFYERSSGVAIIGQVKSNEGKPLERVKESHPEVYPNWINFRFPGRGQRETPIADVRGIVEIVMLLPSGHAARVRCQAAELLCR